MPALQRYIRPSLSESSIQTLMFVRMNLKKKGIQTFSWSALCPKLSSMQSQAAREQTDVEEEVNVKLKRKSWTKLTNNLAVMIFCSLVVNKTEMYCTAYCALSLYTKAVFPCFFISGKAGSNFFLISDFFGSNGSTVRIKKRYGKKKDTPLGVSFFLPYLFFSYPEFSWCCRRTKIQVDMGT